MKAKREGNPEWPRWGRVAGREVSVSCKLRCISTVVPGPGVLVGPHRIEERQQLTWAIGVV